ncbi:glycoside hydrolase family 3 N-terminal domain-containing protein [Leucobacter denitrificans]|uniref:Glycoside hydrolase family 3 protein n=1 Tax=Leucobacter denitrificans TaxID=683042 RepID=A0A7G9S739_9MICO|nr:glycoside hydrolase family 3 N-terminal domain-containing protein [Leucobacter denitrificans]QNN63664.1 glycoside hydrolase family 3 protein [Leucobacter denitrificans]
MPAVRTRLGASIIAMVALFGVALLGCAPEAADPRPEPPQVTETPEPPTPEELRHQAATAWVDQATPRELAGSVIMASISGTDAGALRGVMEAAGLGGFIMMGSNVPTTADELAALTANLTVDPQLPPLVAVDEEGGVVTRLPWDEFAGANTLRFAPATETEAAFRGRAELLAASGLNVNFGVVADVTSDANSFIYLRTLGDDPQAAATRVAAAVTGERIGDVATTLKHFPGHGAAPGDSHLTIPQADMSLEQWRASDALPFEAGIEAGAELLMFGHLRFTQVSAAPASLAPEWYDIAREDLGFEGVIVTDDLGMLQASGEAEFQDPVKNVVTALGAGADLALVVVGMDTDGVVAVVDGVTAAVESGALPRERLREAAIHCAELRLTLADSGQSDSHLDTAQDQTVS